MGGPCRPPADRSGRGPRPGPGRGFLLGPLLILALACAGGEATPSAPIDRETFVETYVDLRIAALEQMDLQIRAQDRNRILDERSVTEEDLLAFVEAHGGDVPFMQQVWDDVEARIQARSVPAPDTVPQADSTAR